MSNETTAFIDYWNAVDAALIRFFGIDTADAGIDVELIAGAQEEGRHRKISPAGTATNMTLTIWTTGKPCVARRALKAGRAGK